MRTVSWFPRRSFVVEQCATRRTKQGVLFGPVGAVMGANYMTRKALRGRLKEEEMLCSYM